MITGGDLRQSRLDVGYKTFTISPWVDLDNGEAYFLEPQEKPSLPITLRLKRAGE